MIIMYLAGLSMVMQLPVLLLIVLFCRHADISLSIKEFKLIWIGWVMNLIYLIFASLGFFTMTHDIQLKFVESKLFELFRLFFAFIYILLFLLATKNFHEIWLYKWLKKVKSIKIIFYSVSIVIPLSIFKIYYVPELYGKSYNFFVQLPFTLFYLYGLISLALFFKNLDEIYNKYKLLSHGILIYAIIQFLTLFDTSNHANYEYLVGFLFGFISKIFIVYGLHHLFLYHAENYKSEELFATRLNNTLGRVFHELQDPLKATEKNIVLLLDEDDKNIRYSSKARNFISNIEMHHSRAYANFIASKRYYAERIKADEKHRYNIDFPEIKYETNSKSMSVNSLLEMVVIALKHQFPNEIKFRIQYSSNCNLQCNPNEMIAIFYNIMKNSYDSYEENKKFVEIKTQTTKIRIDENKYDRFIKITISDKGKGIPVENMSKIFIEGFSTNNEIGRGHGLNIVKDLTEKNSGKIEIFSNQKSSISDITTSIVLLFKKGENI